MLKQNIIQVKKKEETWQFYVSSLFHFLLLDILF